MPLAFWKEDTLDVLRRYTGPAAEQIVTRCVGQVRIRNTGMTAANYFRFLRQLGREVPQSVDRATLLQQLKRNAFGRILDNDQALPHWPARSRELLLRQFGPAGDRLAEEAMERIPSTVHQHTVAGFLEFMDQLEPLLPADISTSDVIGRLKKQILLHS